MGLFKNTHESRHEERIIQLDYRYKESKHRLYDELIRGELIEINKSLGYLSRLEKKGEAELKRKDMGDKGFYMTLAAKDCYAKLNFINASAHNPSPEFIAGINAVKGKIYKEIVRICPHYAIEPIEALILLAENDIITEISDYVNELITAIERNS